MISNYAALGIFDRLSMLRLRMQEMTQLCLMAKEGVLQTDAAANTSSRCLGSLYTLLDSTTESLESILKDFDKILEKDKMEECNDEVYGF